MKLAVVVGTRPEIIKMQPVINEIEKRGHDLVFIETGQHYDFIMSHIFIRELKLRRPNYSLTVNSRSQGNQTADIIRKSEAVLQKEKPDMVLVEGDTNSAFGAALASSKLGIQIGHVEAGCRSFDKRMPEEINRVLIADLARLHFSPTPNCTQNLLREGISPEQIYLTGHPLVDLLRDIEARLLRKNLVKFGPKGVPYIFVTVHRRENIQNKRKISEILAALNILAETTPIVFPCHPHTKSQLTTFGLTKYLGKVRVIDPVGYFDSLNLIKNARLVLTDSGGVQQEAALLNTPCVTLREITEWVETVNHGVNFLAGYKEKTIIKTVKYLEKNLDDILGNFNTSHNLFGEPGVSSRILKIIERWGRLA